MPKLSDPLTLPCGVVLPNRIGKSALTEGLGDADNHATVAHQRLYSRWSRGGAGLLVTGNIQVDRRFLERPGNVAVDGERGKDALIAYAKASMVNGNQCWVQLNHPGRQVLAQLHPEPLAPSAVPLTLPGFNPPRALTSSEVDDIIDQFGEGARLAQSSGFSGVQAHSAHGYLLSQFLSPLVNKRTDQWGGSLENRARALLEVVRRMRQVVGNDYPVCVKLNSADFQNGGFEESDCLQVVAWLKDAGLDLLEISGGNYEKPRFVSTRPAKDSTVRREAYFLEFAAKLREAVPSLPLMVTGGFRSREAMDAALDSGVLDMIGLGRPLIVAPEGPSQLIAGAIDRLPAPELELGFDRADLEKRLGPELALEARNWSVQGWFCVQLLKLGAGEDPDPKLDLEAAFLRYHQNEKESAERVQTARRVS